MRAPYDYCEHSVELGERFPDLVGGAIGLVVGIARGSVVAAQRLAGDAIWMDSYRSGLRPCGCCGSTHRVLIADCGPCAQRSGRTHCG